MAASFPPTQPAPRPPPHNQPYQNQKLGAPSRARRRHVHFDDANVESSRKSREEARNSRQMLLVISTLMALNQLVSGHSVVVSAGNQTEANQTVSNETSSNFSQHLQGEMKSNLKLDLQIFIADDENSKQTQSNNAKKSPYSYQDQSEEERLKGVVPGKLIVRGPGGKPQSLALNNRKHFYLLQGEANQQKEVLGGRSKLPIFYGSSSSADKPRKRPASQRSELLRTQHRPPAFWPVKRPANLNIIKTSPRPEGGSSFTPDLSTSGSSSSGLSVSFMNKPQKGRKKNKFRLSSTTTPMPSDFFRLISSAHSPPSRSRLNNSKLSLASSKERLSYEYSPSEPPYIYNQHSLSKTESTSSPNSALGLKSTIGTTSYHDLLPLNSRRSSSTTTPLPVMRNSEKQPEVDKGVTSATIDFVDERESDVEMEPQNDSNEVQTNTLNDDRFPLLQRRRPPTGSGDQQQVDSGDPRSQLVTISNKGASEQVNEVPLTYYNGPNRRPVTIIRKQPAAIIKTTPAILLPPPNRIKLEPTTLTTTTTTTSTTTTALSSSGQAGQQLLLPEPPVSVTISSSDSTGSGNSNSNSTGQLVRLIAKQKHKFDDNVTSPTLTVVDNAALRLPPNSTSVHNNKLVVAIRPGRPQRRYPPTTQFPYYNMVAGFKPAYLTSSSPNLANSTYNGRPPQAPGMVYGIMKTNSTTTTTTTQTPFGAQKVTFPAALPGVIEFQPAPVEIIEKVNISVPDNANIVGPNKIPDRLQMETQEQHFRPPPETILLTQEQQMRPITATATTTRKPARQSTTKRINIVSANTTVVTTNVDELHDVLSDVIAGSHHQHQINTHQRPQTPKPGLLASISNLFNAGITSSALAVLALVKTIFVAILVMFLPPIALTAAIMQAVSIG